MSSISTKIRLTPISILGFGTRIFFVICKHDEQDFSNGIFVQKSELDVAKRSIMENKECSIDDPSIYDLENVLDQISLLKIYEIPKSIISGLTPDEKRHYEKGNELFVMALSKCTQKSPADVQNERSSMINDTFSKIIIEVTKVKSDASALVEILEGVIDIKRKRKSMIPDN